MSITLKDDAWNDTWDDSWVEAAIVEKRWDELLLAYEQAANASNDADASCFQMTHALVYALLAGDCQSEQRISDYLAERGRF